MASNIEFVQYVCDQISDAGKITFKKMFGEYGIYYNQKIIGLISDDQFFIKITENGRKFMEENFEDEIIEAPAYQGAKPSFLIENLDDKEALAKLIKITYLELPEPKFKNKKQLILRSKV